MSASEIVTEGGTVEQALEAALAELGVSGVNQVEYRILEEPARALFGLSAGKPARVHVWVKGTEPQMSFEEESEAEEDVEESGADDAPNADQSVEGAARAEEPQEEISDADLDAIADAAVASIREILKAFNVTAGIDEYEGDEGEIILDVVNGDLGILIGRHGKTLDALQTIVVALVNRKIERRHPILVDVEGYRARRRVKLEEMAHGAAERAHRSGRPVSMRPMTSYERKVIHVALREDRRVETGSEGEDPYRRVVISPV